MNAQPLLEIGGTHVTAALVDPSDWTVLEAKRFGLDPAASADELIEVFADAARAVGPTPCTRWGIGIPGPFDYEHGVGDFTGVEKFGALKGVDIGARLRDRLEGVASEFVFVNDADAFAMGAWIDLDPPVSRALFLTLGTGIGSSYLAAGAPVTDAPGVPPEGSVHLLQWQGRPIEQTVSRRAIIRAYTGRTGRTLDVHEIARAAEHGDSRAVATLDHALHALGACIADSVTAFGSPLIVVGGSIAGSWDQIRGPLIRGLADGGAGEVRVVPSGSGDDAALVGTARAARLLRPASPA